MLHQAMLYEKGIVLLIICYVEMGSVYYNSILFKLINGVHKDIDLHGAPIHVLDLVLNLKSVIFGKINVWQNHIFAQILHKQ